jgi:hypothetical protein
LEKVEILPTICKAGYKYFQTVFRMAGAVSGIGILKPPLGDPDPGRSVQYQVSEFSSHLWGIRILAGQFSIRYWNSQATSGGSGSWQVSSVSGIGILKPPLGDPDPGRSVQYQVLEFSSHPWEIRILAGQFSIRYWNSQATPGGSGSWQVSSAILSKYYNL